MMAITLSLFLGTLLFLSIEAAPTVDESYPYTGPAVPVGDWVDPTVRGNGKGFARVVEAPAVTPSSLNPTNNVNVISLSYLQDGINIHYQTPFNLGTDPSVNWGADPSALINTVTGLTHSFVF